jgi:hypothetical protein
MCLCNSLAHLYFGKTLMKNKAIKIKKETLSKDDDFIEKRASVVDRRLGLDRRRGPGRRLTEDRKSAEEGQMSQEQFEFLMAIDEYKQKNSRPFPTWTEVLELVKALGYRKVAEPQSIEQHTEIEESNTVPLEVFPD